MTHGEGRFRPPLPGYGRNMTDRDASDLSTVQVVQNLTTQIGALVRTELQLARAEMQAKARGLAVGAGMLAVAAALLLFAAGAAIAALVLGLAIALPGWAAALVTAAILTVLAGLTVLIGRSTIRRAAPPLPSGAVEDLKEDLATITAAARRE